MHMVQIYIQISDYHCFSTTMYWGYCSIILLSTGAFVVVLFVIVYLLLGGDIETNPGPSL